MKSKGLIAAVVAVVVILGAGLILKGNITGKAAVKAAVPKKGIKAAVKAVIPAKTFSKEMGGLTVQVVNTKNKAIAVRGRVFKSVDSKSSVCVGSLSSNRMQELLPGDYDVELDTVPQKIYKDINVSKGRETVENLGCVTGILNVKILDAKNKIASYPVRIYYPKTKNMVTTATANRPLEILAGVYDVEISVIPKALENSVSVEAGKEKVLDLGVMTGAIIVKVLDENKVEKKNARQSVRVRKADNDETLISSIVNRPIEVRQGIYTIEVGTMPPQIKKDVKINAGEEVVLEVVAQTPAVPAVKAVVPAPVQAQPQSKAPAPAPASKVIVPVKGK